MSEIVTVVRKNTAGEDVAVDIDKSSFDKKDDVLWSKKAVKEKPVKKEKAVKEKKDKKNK